MVDLLDDIEFNLHNWSLLRRSTTIPANLLSLLVIIGSIRGDRIRELHLSDLQIILYIAGCVCSNQESMRGIVLAGYSEKSESMNVTLKDRPHTPVCPEAIVLLV